MHGVRTGAAISQRRDAKKADVMQSIQRERERECVCVCVCVRARAR